MIKINNIKLEDKLIKTEKRAYSKGLNSYQVQKIVELYHDKSIKVGDISKKFNELQREYPLQDNFKPTSFSVSTLYRILNSYQEQHEKHYNRTIDYVGFRRENKKIKQRRHEGLLLKKCFQEKGLENEQNYFMRFKKKIRNTTYNLLSKVSSKFRDINSINKKIDVFEQGINYIKEKYLENDNIKILDKSYGLEKMINSIRTSLYKIKMNNVLEYQKNKIEELINYADYYSLNICA